MNKKEELKKLIEEQKGSNSFLSFITPKRHALFGLIFSPIFILIIIADWSFDFIDYSNGTPSEIFRPLSLIIGIILFIYSWFNYKYKARTEKENKEKMEKIINDLKE